MSDERIDCATPGCGNSILPATAARTGGICRPCEQRIAREKHQAYVRENRRVVDRFEGVSDPVAIIEILARPLPFDELLIEKPFQGDVGQLFQSLSDSDLHRVVRLSNTLLNKERTDEAAEVALWLACFTTADLADLQKHRALSRELHPGIVFRRGGESVREAILDSFNSETGSLLLVSHALTALAWIGDDIVRGHFSDWRRHRPIWSKSLYVPPESYSRQAGWEIDENDRRRELFSEVAFSLIPASVSTATSPVEVVLPARGSCQWCGGPLTTLLRFDLRTDQLSELILPSEVVSCALCTCYGPFFMKLDDDGEARWHEANELPEYLPGERGESWTAKHRLILGDRRIPLQAADPFLPTTFSQVGGAPAWIQDEEYPDCPDCLRTMPFIAQIASDEVDEDAEGFYYAFWCSTCGVTATGYQQT